MRILFNARIHTLDPRQPMATAVAIRDSQILAIGQDPEILAEFSSGAQPQDMRGRTIWPGLTDAHIHLDYYALGLQKVDCETRTRAECLERVAIRARQTGPGEWILGHGWNQNEWPEGFGSAALLDQVAPENPVYLTAKSLHAGWANSLALQKAGIHHDTPDPRRGTIQRDNQGNPTGILLESGMELVGSCLPEQDEREVAAAILQAQSILWKMGITGVHDYDQRRCFAALQILHERGELRLRVVKSIPADALPHAAALGLRSGFGSNFLRIGSVKLFADGALGPQTAAMLQPYEGAPDQFGMLLLDEEEILETGRQAAASGLSLAIHAIGDRANHAVLNAYEQLRVFEDQHSLPHRRHRIEHVQIIHPADAHRLAQLGVIASMQPLHATSDMFSADQHWGARSASAYAWRTMLDHHIALAFGSDAPVESPNPFWGLHAAVTRRRQDGTPGSDGWYPEQRLLLMEALQAYTTGAAYAAGLENRLGKLTPGFDADLIVLDRDPFQMLPGDLVHVSPAATMVAGDWVWEGDSQ